MYKDILIPVALDQEAVVPRKLALARHLLSPGGRITLLTVLEDVPGFVAEFVDLDKRANLTAKVRERLEAVAGGAADTRCEVIKGRAGIAIARFAEAKGVDLIIVGSHHPGAQDYFLGSTAARVVRRAPCSVHVLR
jgi:nucleotide-binding universal stress UspA family protein